jgi:hypothetical protein
VIIVRGKGECCVESRVRTWEEGGDFVGSRLRLRFVSGERAMALSGSWRGVDSKAHEQKIKRDEMTRGCV